MGKSKLAFKLAKEIDGEVIVADSVKVYKHLDIGSNKPAAFEQSIIDKVPLHMIDCYELDQMFTVWDFYHRSRAHIADVLSRNKVPIIVGGTPFYLRSLVQGVIEAPKKDHKLFNEIYHQLVHENNWNKNLKRLQEVDPAYAESLLKSPGNYMRMARAFEVLQKHGKPLSSYERVNKDLSELDYDFRMFSCIRWPRELVYRRMDLRCEKIVINGLIQEVGELIRKGLMLPNSPPARSIGYRQVIEYLVQQKFSDSSFIEFMLHYQAVTRNFASHQLKWFRADPHFHWLELGDEGDTQRVLDMFSMDQSQFIRTLESTAHQTQRTKLSSQNKNEMAQIRTYMPRFELFKQLSEIDKQNHIAAHYASTLDLTPFATPSPTIDIEYI